MGEESDWLAIRERIERIVESEFEECYPERITVKAIQAERDRIWNAIQQEAAERVMAQNPGLSEGEPVRVTLLDVIHQLLDEFEAGRYRP
jgi:hypothetical protein